MNLYVTKHAKQRSTQRLGFGRMEARAKLKRIYESARPVENRDLPKWFTRPVQRNTAARYRLGRWLDKELVLVVGELASAEPCLVTVVTPDAAEQSVSQTALPERRHHV
jgi:hypothetical protein